jgi:hypothetical protein
METGSHGAHRRVRLWKRVRVSVASDCAALRSPWIFATVVVMELARLIWAERIDEPSHCSHALLWRQRRLGAAHIGPNPSRVDQNTSDAARRQIDRSASHHHIHRRLGATIGNGAARPIVGERTHATRYGDHHPSLTAGNVITDSENHPDLADRASSETGHEFLGVFRHICEGFADGRIELVDIEYFLPEGLTATITPTVLR